MLAKHIIIGLISAILVSGTVALENQHGKPVQIKTKEIVDVIERVKARGLHAFEEEKDFFAKVSDSLKFAPKLKKERIEYLQFPLENVSYYMVTAREGKALEALTVTQNRFKEIKPLNNAEIRDEVRGVLENARYELDNMLISPTVLRAENVVLDMLFELYIAGDENQTYYENLLSHSIKTLPKMYDSIGEEAGVLIAEKIAQFGIHAKKIQKTGIEEDQATLYDFIISTPALMNVATMTNIGKIIPLEEKRTIELMNRVKEVLEEGKISIRTTQELNTFFMQEAGLKRDELEKTENELFAFLEFLNNPQYTSLRGTVKENFAQFKRDRKEASDILEFVEELKTEEAGEESRDVMAEVRMDFEKVRTKNIQLEVMSEGDNPEVRVKGEISKITFTGIYNVNRATITDLEVGGERIGQAIPLQQLRSILVKKFGANKGESAIPEKAEETASTGRAETSLDTIAISVVYGELTKMGIELDKENIKVVDVNRGIFEVKTSTVTFTVHKKENKVSDLAVNSPIGEILVNGDVMFAELKKRIDSILQMAEESL